MKKYMTIILIIFAAAAVNASEVKLPPITENTLGNGLTVVTVENHELPTITMKMVIRSGSADDPKGKAGLVRAGTSY